MKRFFLLTFLILCLAVISASADQANMRLYDKTTANWIPFQADSLGQAYVNVAGGTITVSSVIDTNGLSTYTQIEELKKINKAIADTVITQSTLIVDTIGYQTTQLQNALDTVDIKVSDRYSNYSETTATLTATVDTFNLLVEYDIVQITADTDCIISVTSPTLAVSFPIWQKSILVLDNVQTIYARNLGGVASGTIYISARRK